MRAVTFEQFGAPEVLHVGTMPDPHPKAGEVVIQVAASTVNPTDTLMRAGKQSALMDDLKPPFIAGMEFAGHVHMLGEAVEGLSVGEPVMGVVNPRRSAGGAHAEFICVPAASVAPLRASADLTEAATIPMNGLTALIVMESLEPLLGDTVLVTGAAGAVGGYVIQLAKSAGFRVLADAKTDDVELVRRLGAEIIVPRGDGFAAAVTQACPDGVDAVVDCALLGDRVSSLVRKGGIAISLRRANAIRDSRLRTAYVSVTDRMTDAKALARLSELFSSGILSPRVAMRLPMSEAPQAHKLVEQGGVRGRVVLTFNGCCKP